MSILHDERSHCLCLQAYTNDARAEGKKRYHQKTKSSLLPVMNRSDREETASGSCSALARLSWALSAGEIGSSRTQASNPRGTLTAQASIDKRMLVW
jgi:hypothetical protein